LSLERSPFPSNLSPALQLLSSMATRNPQQPRWARPQVKEDAGNSCELCASPLGKDWRISAIIPPVLGGTADRSNVLATCMKCSGALAGRDWLAVRRSPTLESLGALEKRRLDVLFRSEAHPLLDKERSTEWKARRDLKERFGFIRSAVGLAFCGASVVLGWPQGVTPSPDLLAYLWVHARPILDKESGVVAAWLPPYQAEEIVRSLIELNALVRVIDASEGETLQAVSWSSSRGERLRSMCQVRTGLPALRA
jgi:hypothetical protein